MSTQRKLLTVLLLIAAVLAVLLLIALRAGPAELPGDPLRENEAAPPVPLPSEPTESAEGRSALAPAADPGPAQPAHQPGPPVKIVGRIGDGKGNGLEGVNVLVYDSRGEKHKPEVLRPDWYECTIHERGRALVVAQREDNCRAEVPFEVLPPDVERHVDLVLPARPVLRVHLRDPAGKPLPRFGKGQPLRAKVSALASVEELPAQLPAPMVKSWSIRDADARPAWADFEPESLAHLLSTRAGMHLPGGARGKRNRSTKSSRMPWTVQRELEW